MPPEWQQIRVKLKDLKPWPMNPRQSTKKQAARLLASFDEFGQVQTVAVGPDLEVYDGHQRLSALLTVHGPDYEIDARQSSRLLTDAERRKLVAWLHAGAVGSWDWDALSSWDAGELIDWGFDSGTLADWKRDVSALDNLLESEKPEPSDAEPDIDRAEVLREKWGTERGQLWRIGDHRLLCGDSTVREDVERVMGGEKADCIFTDPPYNVASESRNYAADKSKAMADLKNAEWDHDFDITTVLPSFEIAMADDCAVYVCTSQWLVHTIWEWMWKWSDFCSYNVWCKPNPMPSLSKRHWTWATELIAYAVRGRHTANFPNGEHALNWWNIPKDKDTEHPTEKPVTVPSRAISFSSNERDIIADFFAGSGTTLVACENLGRKCRAIEISPAYCAVILERMATAFPEIEIEQLST